MDAACACVHLHLSTKSFASWRYELQHLHLLSRFLTATLEEFRCAHSISSTLPRQLSRLSINLACVVLVANRICLGSSLIQYTNSSPRSMTRSIMLPCFYRSSASKKKVGLCGCRWSMYPAPPHTPESIESVDPPWNQEKLKLVSFDPKVVKLGDLNHKIPSDRYLQRYEFHDRASLWVQ
jgi:hypothetical protein